MVKWSAAAKRDLKEIHAYIARDSRYYARQVVEKIIEKSLSIESHFPFAAEWCQN